MSCERMTRLASAGRPFSVRSTAAEVSSQLVSMPRTRLIATEQLGHQALVRDGAPGMLADDLLDDDPLLVEEEALRHSGRLVDLLDVAAPVVEDLEGEAQLVRERAHLLDVTVVDAHGDDAEPLRPELAPHLLDGRHLRAAGNAPGRPDVDEAEVRVRCGRHPHRTLYQP